MGDVGPPPRRLGVIVGLPQEAAILKRALGKAAPPIVCGGAQSAGAARAVAELVAAGADALLSFGFAGGLDPSLRPGDLVVGAGVVAVDSAMRASDDALSQRLCAALDTATCGWAAGLVAHADQVVDSPAAKRALFARTRALLVDMESRAAGEAGLPFAILRAVVDPAERALPSSALAALKPNGRIDSLTLVGGLLRRPREIGTLLVLARDNAAARESLSRAAAAAGRAFGLV